MSRKPSLTVTSDFTEHFNEIVRKFKRDAVLVGIPEANGERDAEESESKSQISNAALLAIMNFGSALNNIPAWPVMAIGIQKAQTEIVAQLKRGAQLALSQGFSAIDTYYNRAGLIASNSIKKVINAQEDVPKDRPTDSTLGARKRDGFKGTKYWIVTGQMRNAITYVIKGEVKGGAS